MPPRDRLVGVREAVAAALTDHLTMSVSRHTLCRPAIAVVLGFIGVKLIGSFAGYEISTETSLLLVLATLGTGVGASVVEARQRPTDEND